MRMNQFFKKSGLKVLAMAGLSQCEYSIILYLMNCSVSGLDEIITSETELSNRLEYSEKVIRKSIASLSERHIIKILTKNQTKMGSFSLGFQYEIEEWKLNRDAELNSHEAIIYPFSRSRKTHLEIIARSVLSEDENNISVQTWERVCKAFRDYCDPDKKTNTENEKYAKILVDTHPVDQVIFFIRYFKHRIISLSLLASNWVHFQELYEVETQKIDLVAARKKHIALDEKLKESAKNWIDMSDQYKLSDEEINVLKLFIRHRHPRRQLFWAFQARSRYVHLNDFFIENFNLMLAVTNMGAVIKKNPF